VLLIVGLWNATLLPSEKGFYAFAFLLSLFGAIAVQKNTRDSQGDFTKHNWLISTIFKVKAKNNLQRYCFDEIILYFH